MICDINNGALQANHAGRNERRAPSVCLQPPYDERSKYGLIATRTKRGNCLL